MSALECDFGRLALVGGPGDKRRRDEGESSRAGAARAVKPLECVCCGDEKTCVLVCRACHTVGCKECYLRYFTDSPDFSRGAMSKSSLAYALSQKVHVDAPACMEPKCRRVFAVEELHDIMSKAGAQKLVVECRRLKLDKQDSMFVADTIEHVVPLCREVDALYARLERLYTVDRGRGGYFETVDNIMHEIAQCRNTIMNEPMGVISGQRPGAVAQKKRFVSCTQPECAGMFKYDGAHDNECMICSVRHCRACLTRMDEGHVCSPGAVESAQLILTTTKPCPTCATPISKTDGCDQMMCMNPTCHAVFSWSTGRLEVGGVHNPYIYTLSLEMQETVRARTRAGGGGVAPQYNALGLVPVVRYLRRNMDIHTAVESAADRLQIAAAYRLADRMRGIHIEEQLDDLTRTHEESLELRSRMSRLELLLKKRIFVKFGIDKYNPEEALAVLRNREYTELELKQVEAKKSANSLRMDTKYTNSIGKLNAQLSFLGVFTTLANDFVTCDDATAHPVVEAIKEAVARLFETMGAVDERQETAVELYRRFYEDETAKPSLDALMREMQAALDKQAARERDRARVRALGMSSDVVVISSDDE